MAARSELGSDEGAGAGVGDGDEKWKIWKRRERLGAGDARAVDDLADAAGFQIHEEGGFAPLFSQRRPEKLSARAVAD